MTSPKCPKCGSRYCFCCPTCKMPIINTVEHHNCLPPTPPPASPAEPLDTLPLRRMLKRAVDLYTPPPESTPAPDSAREWSAREIYAKWARHEHKEMPAAFVNAEAHAAQCRLNEELAAENAHLRVMTGMDTNATEVISLVNQNLREEIDALKAEHEARGKVLDERLEQFFALDKELASVRRELSEAKLAAESLGQSLGVAAQERDSAREDKAKAFAEVDHLTGRCDRYRQALEFCADPNNYTLGGKLCGDHTPQLPDHGKRARDALEGK